MGGITGFSVIWMTNFTRQCSAAFWHQKIQSSIGTESSIFTVTSWQSHIESGPLYNMSFSEYERVQKMLVVQHVLDGVFGGFIYLGKISNYFKISRYWFFFYKGYLYFELKGICLKIPPCIPYLMNTVLDRSNQNFWGKSKMICIRKIFSMKI